MSNGIEAQLTYSGPEFVYAEFREVLKNHQAFSLKSYMG